MNVKAYFAEFPAKLQGRWVYCDQLCQDVAPYWAGLMFYLTAAGGLSMMLLSTGKDRFGV